MFKILISLMTVIACCAPSDAFKNYHYQFTDSSGHQITCDNEYPDTQVNCMDLSGCNGAQPSYQCVDNVSVVK